MKIKDLYPGQKVHIKLLNIPESVEIDSAIVKVDKDRLYLDFPAKYSNKMFHFREAQETELSIYTQRRVIIMSSLIIDTPYEQDFTLELNEEFMIIQRRQYVRSIVKLDISVSQGQKFFFNTKTANIGGGGLKFISNNTFKPGDYYDFALKMPSWEFPVEGNGVIVDNIEQDGVIFSMLKFDSISESDRNKIIKHCFDEEVNFHRHLMNVANNE